MRNSIHAQRLILLFCLVLLAAGAPSSVGEAAIFAAPASQAFSCAAVSQIPQSECEALVALYNSTNGPGWFPQTGWLTTYTPAHDMNQNELWSDYSSVVFVNAIYLPLIAQ